MRCPQPDWLDNRLTVTGLWQDYRDFRRAAAGAGMAGWVLDYDRLEESLVLLMLAQPLPPGVARIPAAGQKLIDVGLGQRDGRQSVRGGTTAGAQKGRR